MEWQFQQSLLILGKDGQINENKKMTIKKRSKLRREAKEEENEEKRIRKQRKSRREEKTK